MGNASALGLRVVIASVSLVSLASFADEPWRLDRSVALVIMSGRPTRPIQSSLAAMESRPFGLGSTSLFRGGKSIARTVELQAPASQWTPSELEVIVMPASWTTSWSGRCVLYSSIIVLSSLLKALSPAVEE